MPPNCNFSSKVLFVVVVGVLAFSVSNGQELFSGWCPKIQALSPFLVHNYSGLWYEVEKYWFVPEAFSSCVVVSYVDNGDQTFTVNINQQVNGGLAQWNNPGITRYSSPDKNASFVLDLIVSQSPLPFVVSYPYIVVDTDYTNYTIKYSCQQIGFFNMQSMWILTRDRSLSPELRQKIHAKLTSLGLNTSRLLASDLSTCSHLTESAPGVPLPINRNRTDSNRRGINLNNSVLPSFLPFFNNRRLF